MAGKRKDTTPKAGPDDKSRVPATVPTTLYLTVENLKLLKIGAIEEGPDMSAIVNQLIAQKYAGWHIRRGRGEGAASPSVESQAQPTVTIPTVMNRISQIHRSATAPVDSALDGFSDDQP